MISILLARQLRELGLAWRPNPGDVFVIDIPEAKTGLFTVSNATLEIHELPTATLLGSDGTTEQPLDSAARERALWLPREDQLRQLLGQTFRSLSRADGVYRVETVFGDEVSRFDAAEDPADAYALALRTVLRRKRG